MAGYHSDTSDDHSTGLRRKITIANVKGLHARPAAALARCAGSFDARITVRHKTGVADGSSIMDLLMLAASCGASLDIAASGPEADKALTAIQALAQNRFGESR